MTMNTTSMTRAAALATRPRSAPARNRHSADALGSALVPRSAAAAGSAQQRPVGEEVPACEQGSRSTPR